MMWLMWRRPGCLVALAAHPPVGAPLMQSSVRASRHLTRFRPVPLLLRAGPPPRFAWGACVRALRARGTWLSVTYFGPPRWRTSSLTRSRSRLTSSVFFFGTSHLPLVCPRAYLLSAQISTGTFARKTAARTLHTATAPGARGSHHITHIQGNFTSYTFRDQPPQQPNEHDAYIYGIRVRRPSPVAPTHSPAMLGLTSLLADPYMYRPAALGGSASRSTKSMKLDRSARPSN